MDDANANITDAELEILKVLWANKMPMTDRQIRDTLSASTVWKKGTIQTLTRRLVEKGVLIREQREVFVYTPAISQEDYAKNRTKDLLHRVFGGNARSMFATLLNNDVLSKEDMDSLQEYWRERRELKDE